MALLTVNLAIMTMSVVLFLFLFVFKEILFSMSGFLTCFKEDILTLKDAHLTINLGVATKHLSGNSLNGIMTNPQLADIIQPYAGTIGALSNFN